MLDDLVGRKWERFLNVLRGASTRCWTRQRLGTAWVLLDDPAVRGGHRRDVPRRRGLERFTPPGEARYRAFQCKDVLRFLGRRLTASLTQEVTSELRELAEGVRIKHWVGENSIKMYDKQKSVLRIETTINNPRHFKSFREMIRNGRPCWQWLPMRKGLADMARRVEISRARISATSSAAVVGVPAPTREVLDPLSKRVQKEGRPYRALRPIAAGG